MAELLYTKAKMSQAVTDELMTVFNSIIAKKDPDAEVPFSDVRNLLATIDAIDLGDAPWIKRMVGYNHPVTPQSPSWQRRQWEVYYRNPDQVIANILANPDFDGLIDYQPFKEFSANGTRRYNEFMSGLFCWEQAVSWSLDSFFVFLIYSFKEQNLQ
jgi:hypothetical protein